MTDATPFRLGHRRWLDGLRGVAILLVLGSHFGLVRGGFLGVDVFFVLSGFLITTLLAEEWRRDRAIDLPRFYLRRALRLLPAYLALLAVCAAATAAGSPARRADGFREVLVAGAYVSNWPTLHQTALPRLGHTWSLAVEEQFYLAWPVVLLALLRSHARRGTVLAVVGGFALLSAGWRAALHATHAPDEPQVSLLRLYMGLDTRADALLIGCGVGLLAVWGWLPTGRRFAAASGAAAALAAAALAVLSCSR